MCHNENHITLVWLNAGWKWNTHVSEMINHITQGVCPLSNISCHMTFRLYLISLWHRWHLLTRHACTSILQEVCKRKPKWVAAVRDRLLQGGSDAGPALKNIIKLVVYLNNSSYYSNKNTCQTGGIAEMNVIGFVTGVTATATHVRATQTLHEVIIFRAYY